MTIQRSIRLLVILICGIALVINGRKLYRRYLNHKLAAAVFRSDLASVQALLARGADPNYKPDGKSSLILALSNHALGADATDTDAVRCLLLKHGSKIEDNCKDQLFYEAVSLGNVDLLQCLLDTGYRPSSALKSGYPDILDTAITYSSKFQSPDALRLVPLSIRTEKSKRMIRLLEEHGLHLSLSQAIEMRDLQTVKAMLAAGASVNSHDRYRTPLGTAVSNGDIDLVNLLLAHGADPNVDTQTTPLVSALYGRNVKIARILLAHGADVKARHAKNQVPPLTAAVACSPQFVPELLQRGADVNENQGAPLKAAIAANNPKAAKFLIQHGARVNPISYGIVADQKVVQGPEGPTLVQEPHRILAPSLLTTAVEYGPKCFDLLVQAGVDFKRDRSRILLAAARNGRTALIPKLIAAGADVNASDDKHDTVLLEAIVHTPASVQILLEHGANPNVIGPQQETPLGLAAGSGDITLVRVLLAHGAQVNIHPPRAHTPLYYALKKQHTEVVEVLRKAGATDDK